MTPKKRAKKVCNWFNEYRMKKCGGLRKFINFIRYERAMSELLESQKLYSYH